MNVSSKTLLLGSSSSLVIGIIIVAGLVYLLSHTQASALTTGSQKGSKELGQKPKGENCPATQEPSVFVSIKGKVINKNGSEQPFTCFRCAYDSAIGHSANWEALISESAGGTTVVTLDKIERIDFTSPTHEDWGRWGTARLVDGRTLRVRLYVKSCEWANGHTKKGSMGDASITALVFTPKR